MQTDNPHILSDENHTDPSWYESFVADYDFQAPKAGQILEGVIVGKTDDSMLVDVGMKRDAIVPYKDLSLIKGEYLQSINVGDQVTVSVLQPPSGQRDFLVSLNKGIQFIHWAAAEKDFSDGNVLVLEISDQNRGGLLVIYKSIRGFLPHSQVPVLRRAKDMQRADTIKKELIGTEIEVKIIEIDRERNRLILSAHAAQKDLRKKRLQELEVGQVIQGSIVNIVDFGIFIDLGEIDGLVHISQLGWERIKHPSDIVQVGETVEAQITDIKIEEERVSLSRKALLPGPWTEFAESHQTGEYIEGTITKILDFGAFIKITDDIEGLIHVSELGYALSKDPHEAVKINDFVLVKILKIEPLRQRVSLSMRQVPTERQISWAMEHFSEKNK